MSQKILIIAAHPDDEVLGCGGTIKRLVDEGYTAYTLILGEGITSRDDKRNRNRRKKDLEELNENIKKANDLLGVKNTFVHDFPDNRFDSIPFLDIVKIIEKIKEKVQPEIIFTHYENDLNIDHKLTYKAAITATRPMHGESVKEIYSFEVLSSTEWSFPLSFSPDVFFDISNYINSKIVAMDIYKSELREHPHPRSLEGIRLNARFWGMKVGFEYAEAFECVRVLK